MEIWEEIVTTGNLVAPKFAIPSNIYDGAFLQNYQVNGLNPAYIHANATSKFPMQKHLW